jgi:AcrR family transcriptional regulator
VQTSGGAAQGSRPLGAAVDRHGRLPPGRHGLSREFVVGNQRARLLEAMVHAVAEHGYAHTSVADVLRRAQVSRRTFYDLFRDRQDCFVQAYDAASQSVRRAVQHAYEQPGTWPERIRAALGALLDLVAVQQDVARIALVEGPRNAAQVPEPYGAAIRGLIPLLDAGREDSPYGAQLTPATAEAIAGGIAAIVHQHLLNGEAPLGASLVGELLGFCLTPYIGPERAASFLAACGD